MHGGYSISRARGAHASVCSGIVRLLSWDARAGARCGNIYPSASSCLQVELEKGGMDRVLLDLALQDRQRSLGTAFLKEREDDMM